MSLVSMIGPRPNLLGHHAGSHYRLEVAQPILTNADLEKIRAISSLVGDAFRTRTIDVTWPASEGAAGHGARGRSHLPRGDRRGAGRLQHSDPVGSRGVVRAHSDAGAAGDRGGASSSDPPGPAHQHRPGRGDRRSARGAPFLRARRLRRGGDQSVSRVRDAGADPRAERPAREAVRGAEELPEGGRQGHPEGDVQDGHLHLSVLLRRADLRRGGTVQRLRGEMLHRHRQHDRGRRLRGDRARGGAAAPATPMATTRSTTGCWTPAATMRSACAARTTPGRRTRWRSCSMRRAATRARSSRAFTRPDQRPEHGAC